MSSHVMLAAGLPEGTHQVASHRRAAPTLICTSAQQLIRTAANVGTVGAKRTHLRNESSQSGGGQRRKFRELEEKQKQARDWRRCSRGLLLVCSMYLQADSSSW